MKQVTKKWIRNEQGSILILGAAGVIMLLALVGGAIDIARYMNVNSKFKDAADTALLSAATVSRSQDVNAVATEYFKANFPEEYSDSLILNAITVTSDPVNLEWTATVTGEVKMAFAKFVGVDSIKLQHKVTVAWDVSTRMEAIFTVDTSASMCMDVARDTKDGDTFILQYQPDYRCKKLNAMKEAMSYVIDNGLAAIEGLGGPAFYAGIVPFNHKIKVANPSALPAALTLSESTNTKGDPNYFSVFDDAEPLSPVVPLMSVNSDEDKQKLKDSINAIVQSPEGRGWTRSNIAVLTAALMLDPQYATAFGGTDKPYDFDPEEVNKIVVMMTDGANVGCCYAVHPEGNYDNQYLYLYKVDNAHLTGIDKAPELAQWAQAYNIPTEGLCDQMKAKGITIYSVVYDVNDGDPGGQEIKDTYRSCASSEQFFFDVQSEDDLKLAYKTIAQSFLKLRIIY